ncbi:MAG: hypothetical protein ACRES9_07625 [Gammaproteobacteria bacterium]
MNSQIPGMKARVLAFGNAVSPEGVDTKQAIEIGRNQGVVAVLLGEVLAVSIKQSSPHSGSFSIGRFSVGGSMQSVKAGVTLQGSLYDVTGGKMLYNFQAEGHASKTGAGDASVGTRPNNFPTSNSFKSSPIGKATTAAGNLVKQVARGKSKCPMAALRRPEILLSGPRRRPKPASSSRRRSSPGKKRSHEPTIFPFLLSTPI